VRCGLPSLHSKCHLSAWLLWPLAFLGGAVTRLSGKTVKLTPFTLNMLLIHRYFSIAKAEALLGYEPLVCFKDGWEATIEAMRIKMQANESPRHFPTSTGKEAQASSPATGSQGWLSPNPMKASGEVFFLAYAVGWIGLMAAIVATRAFENFTPEHYMAVGAVIFVPCVLLPLLFPNSEERGVPLLQRYTLKNNVWNLIVTFYGLWCWQIYFYVVLCTRYTFSVDRYRFINVPICLFGITQGYFTMYHTVSDIVLRAYWRRAGSSSLAYLSKASGAAMLGYAVFIFAFSYAVAFIETFSIQHFPHYDIFDRSKMYLYGSVFYALYFVVTFPMHLGIDEDPKDRWSMRAVVCNALAACAAVTFLLDMWRIAIGPIILDCPFEEARAMSVPFVQP